MDLADITPGMTVADIGAGEGYYTVRLAERVGTDGRVLAQDISREALQRLGRRVERERLENISIKLGEPDDPQLPVDSFDRIFQTIDFNQVACLVQQNLAFLAQVLEVQNLVVFLVTLRQAVDGLYAGVVSYP